MELFDKVFHHYLADKKELKNKAKNRLDLESVAAIKQDIPLFFKENIATLRRNDLIVDSSIGQGNMAEIPWVSIFNRNITTSAQYGYYIVLLFSADMERCFLSLNQAVTVHTKAYTKRDAFIKMIEIAEFAQEYLPINSRQVVGKINLAAEKSLGQGYEHGAIVSFEYTLNSDTAQETLFSDFTYLVECYDLLHLKFGNSLDTLLISSETRFQNEVANIVNKTNSAKKRKALTIEYNQQEGGVVIPEKKKIAGKIVYGRDPLVAAMALIKANFICETDEHHMSFISKTTGENFVEAHHLIPMKHQAAFHFSLDVIENVVALCPNCHRLLHHANLQDKRPILKKLLENKKMGLAARELDIELDDLLKYYI